MGTCGYTTLWLVVWCLVTVYARSPGFKARITTKGLNYANSVAIETLKKEVKQIKIPGINGKVLGASYWIDNIRVTNFIPRETSIGLHTGRGLVWRASNTEIYLHGSWRYKWAFISDHGDFDVKVSGVSFSLVIDVDKDANGRPKIIAGDCSVSVGNVDFRFHGRLSRLYNLFRSHVGNYVKDVLHKQMCHMMKQAANKDGNHRLAKLHVSMPLMKMFLLDYSLTRNPTFGQQYLETYHKGEIYWLAKPTTESPLSPPILYGTAGTDSMLYLWMSDYMFNTMAYQAHRHRVLERNVTKADIPKQYQQFLNTTCPGVCIGSLIEVIGKRYPHSAVEFYIASEKAPTMALTAAGVNIELAGEINMHVRKHGENTAPLLISVRVAMSTKANMSLHKELVYVELKDIQLSIKIRKSSIGYIGTDLIEFVVDQFLKMYLIPHLNGIGAKGFPLPMSNQIRFENAKLSFAQNTVLISTDVKNVPVPVGMKADGMEEVPALLKFRVAAPSLSG